MPSSNINSLNREFSIADNLVFKEGPNGLIYAEVKNDSASAQIFLHGAHITSFIPNGQEAVIFLSPLSQFEAGKAIRGGIPISWPWFANHPTDKTKPAPRTSLWEVRGTKQISKDETQITLGLIDNENTHELWEHSFDLEIVISIGKELNIELTMKNKANEDVLLSAAFHSYYCVQDVSDIAIYGLEGCEYIDKVDNFTSKIEEGLIKITDETDRIYLDTKSNCFIEDPGLNRKIRIEKSGSSSTVVWNPWIEKARQMKDLGDQDYAKFVCVETTNAGTDLITLAPGEQHKLELNVTVESY
jgi:glucose-6-phosphate 1-epimerase